MGFSWLVVAPSIQNISQPLFVYLCIQNSVSSGCTAALAHKMMMIRCCLDMSCV